MKEEEMIELKNKRFELAQREARTMHEGEIVDLLLDFVYNKMSDKEVVKLWKDIFTHNDYC
tara:strand:- start:601 stop:783 length:183 start_codon:yes stop_codon:yes gene_type:complete